MIKIDNNLRQLRDSVLLEADYLNMHADVLATFAKSGTARTALERRLLVAAKACRARAKILHDVLAATDPVTAETS